jgi:hypothetical protein
MPKLSSLIYIIILDALIYYYVNQIHISVKTLLHACYVMFKYC